jgi:hypothetical protein
LQKNFTIDHRVAENRTKPEKAFRTIGSRLKIGDIAQRNNRFQRIADRSNGRNVHFVVDIEKDNKGEYFKIDTDGSVEFHVLGIDISHHPQLRK